MNLHNSKMSFLGITSKIIINLTLPYTLLSKEIQMMNKIDKLIKESLLHFFIKKTLNNKN